MCAFVDGTDFVRVCDGVNVRTHRRVFAANGEFKLSNICFHSIRNNFGFFPLSSLRSAIVVCCFSTFCVAASTIRKQKLCAENCFDLKLATSANCRCRFLSFAFLSFASILLNWTRASSAIWKFKSENWLNCGRSSAHALFSNLICAQLSAKANH